VFPVLESWTRPPGVGGSGTVRRWAAIVTAKLTAIPSHIGNRQRTAADSDFSILILGERARTPVDIRDTVIKTAGSSPWMFAYVRLRPLASALSANDSQ
jgi:hypothetical protein